MNTDERSNVPPAPVTTIDGLEQRLAERASAGEQKAAKNFDPPTEHILQFFAYEHLPPHLQLVSKPFCDLARTIAAGGEVGPDGSTPEPWPLPRNPERTIALRKLLEAKDAAVRALVAK